MTAIDPAPEQPLASGPRAGWYHDPSVADGSRLRWWNGAGWSEHTRPFEAAPPPTAPARAAFPVTAAPAYRSAATSYSTPGQAPATAVSAAAQRTMHNGTAWLSFGLGLLGLSIASLVFFGHRTSIWVSTSGVIAIISGARALRLRSLGAGTAFVPAVLGIGFGSVGTLLMLWMLLGA